MNTASIVYPSMPVEANRNVTEPSSEFKKEVVKVAFAILFFLKVYAILLLAAIGLGLLSAAGGIMLFASHPSFLTLMLGLGLIGLGIMVIFFLVKFIFTSQKVDRSGLIEITRGEQPELFDFIEKITRETETAFPKRIYLSPDVNASVFYDSTVWSMFFPVKKNLQIGLGLVNSVNITEFKAILAHEFGHFSQSSMKLGSYVYNVNKVIYNLLYDNTNYVAALQKWGNASGYFAIFAIITEKIILGIQFILQKLYAIINKSYLSLSRQMEFHADSVAAYVSGSEPLIKSLRRVEAADICYNQLFNFYNIWFKKNIRAENFYPHHTEVMHHFASDFNIPINYGLLQIDAQSLAFFNQSRIVIKDQWSSHPTTDDREKHLNSLNIKAETIHLSAWLVFRNPEELQKKMTDKVYESVNFLEKPKVINLDEFKEHYHKEVEEGNFNKAYKRYFDGRSITEFNLSEEIKQGNLVNDYSFDELVSDSKKNLPNLLNGIKSDLALIESIMAGEVNVKTFDFEGKKFEKHEAYLIKVKLEAELKEAQKQLVDNDKMIFLFFYRRAQLKNKGKEFLEWYEELFKEQREVEEDGKRYNKAMEELSPIYAPQVSFEVAEDVNSKVKKSEIEIKARIKDLLKNENYKSFIDEQQKEKLNNYVSEERDYFVKPSFREDALELLNEALGIYVNVVFDRNFKLKKELFEKQLELLN